MEDWNMHYEYALLDSTKGFKSARVVDSKANQRLLRSRTFTKLSLLFVSFIGYMYSTAQVSIPQAKGEKH